MSRMKRSISQRVLLGVVALSGLVAVGTAAAQGMAKEGRLDVSSCWSGTNSVIAVSKTDLAFSYEMTGTTRSNPSGGAFDMTTFRCVGIVTAIGGKSPGTAVCESVDKDGHKWFAQYVGDGPKYTGTVLAGAGKYEGMTATFNTENVGPFPTVKPGTFQNCNRQTGTYKLK